MKFKTNKKSSFNKYCCCGTISSVFRAKRLKGKILFLVVIVLLFSFFVCVNGRDSIEPELEGKAKALIISQVQIRMFDNELAQLRNNLIYDEHYTDEPDLAVEDTFELHSSKVAYLTFDDGPSTNTDEILDILNEYQVKGTFFTVGKQDASYKRLYQRIVDEGHVLGMHSYSHDYSKIYSSEDAFVADIWRLQYFIYNTTGYMPTIYRFPGGSSNRVSKLSMKKFVGILSENGIKYYDWNVSCGDAHDPMLSVEKIIENVFDGIDKLDNPEDKNEVMILLHDLPEKKSTVEALPGIIEGLMQRDYEILPVNENTKLIQHRDIQ